MDLLELWRKLKDRFEHKKSIKPLIVQYEWIRLCLQDYKSII